MNVQGTKLKEPRKREPRSKVRPQQLSQGVALSGYGVVRDFLKTYNLFNSIMRRYAKKTIARIFFFYFLKGTQIRTMLASFPLIEKR